MNLFRLARLVQDLKALSSPRRAVRRAKNKVVGRTLGRAGFWRWLWK
jgi:hypothetical protein